MFYELVKCARSYRNFDSSKSLSAEDMRQLIELCRYTPSSANLQSVKFAYANEPELCSKVFGLLHWAGYLEDKPPYDGNVPAAYIVLCCDLDISAKPIEVDVGICAQTIVLGAAERGIGACMIGSFDKEKISGIFSLPQNIYPRLVIALGVPKEKVVLTDCVDGNIKYYRDENRVHYVPKRTLDELIING